VNRPELDIHLQSGGEVRRRRVRALRQAGVSRRIDDGRILDAGVTFFVAATRAGRV
jgi:hypothetical protein